MSGSYPSDDVGSNLIDAYLIAVEGALISAGAPRPDRTQVLQDLETQIADMLEPHPLPFTEEAVRAVLDKLEPPSHFAAMYGNGGNRHESLSQRTSATPPPHRFFRLSRPNWPIVAAVSAAFLVAGVLFGVFAAAAGPQNDFLILMTLLGCGVGIVFTPIALWNAYQQLRFDPAAQGRNLVLKSAFVYGTLAPILLVLLAAEATDGAAPILFGIAAFFYAQYALVRRFWQRLSNALPPEPPRPANGNSANTPLTSEALTPAM